MAKELVDAAVGRRDSYDLSGERLKEASLLQSSSPSSIKILVASGDAREEIVGKPDDTIRTMVDLFIDKSEVVVDDSTEFVVKNNDGKALAMEDSLTAVMLKTGDILHVQAVNQGKVMAARAGMAAKSMEDFIGKWQQISGEHYEEFLQALDVNWLLRKAAQVSNQKMEITKKGDNWNIYTSTVLKGMTQEFKLDEPYDERTPDMRDVKTTASFQNGKIVIVEVAKNPKKHKGATIVHDLNGPDEMIYSMWVEGREEETKSTLTFKRVE